MVERAGRIARRWWALGLAGHLATLAVVLLALVPLLDVGTAFTTDEGAYALQVEALEDGGWAVLPPSAAVDPELRFPPWRATTTDEGLVPYDRHPAYPLGLQAASWLGGIDAALLITGLGGVLAATAGAWFLGREVRAGSERLSFWLVAVSPLLLHGYVLWAHAPAAAAACWGAVLMLWAIRRRQPLAWAGCAVALVVGQLIRSESLLFAAAVVAAVGIAGLLRRRIDLIVGAGAVGALLGVVLFVERRVIAGISDTGSGEAQVLSARGVAGSSVDPGYLDGRLEAFRRSMFEGAVFNDVRSRTAQLAVLLLIAAAVLLARRGPLSVAIGCGLGGLTLLVVRILDLPQDPIPGLLTGWPIAVAGVVGAVAIARRGDLALRVLLASGVLAYGAVMATQYVDGGGAWAGRFFTFLVPILAVLAACSWNPRWRVSHRAWVSGLVIVSIVTAASSLLFLRSRRDTYAEISAALREESAELAITPIQFIPRVLWRDHDAWMLVGTAQVDEALDLAEAADVSEVIAVWPSALQPDTSDWRVEPVRSVAATTFDLTLYRLTR